MFDPADSGEDRLVETLLAELPAGQPRRAVHAGAGEDDCAVVRPPGTGCWQLLKTDCVIEGVHFAPGTDPARVGWKALCRPLSDIAATGGTPDHALVTLGLPVGTGPEWARGIYAGIGRAAREFGVSVVGGETAATPGPGWISVCVTGHVPRGECVTRGGGRVGDVLFVTGRLGGSFASGHHLDFRPRLAESRWLVSRFRIRAMMDLSDGLAADLPRLARASGDRLTRLSLQPCPTPMAAPANTRWATVKTTNCCLPAGVACPPHCRRRGKTSVPRRAPDRHRPPVRARDRAGHRAHGGV